MRRRARERTSTVLWPGSRARRSSTSDSSSPIPASGPRTVVDPEDPSIFARCLLALVCVVPTGCATMALRDWAASEVTLHGIGLELDGKPNDAVLLRVKNVMGMEDGDYEIAVPAIDGRSIVLAGDGVLETQPFQELQLASNSGGPGFTATTYMWSWGERDISDARTPLEPGPDDAEAPVSAFSNSAPGLSGGAGRSRWWGSRSRWPTTSSRFRSRSSSRSSCLRGSEAAG